MDFTRIGDIVMAFGEIVHGDSDRFMKFIEKNNMIATDASDTIRLSSPGGNLFEGMALGEAIRRARFNAVVSRGTTCASACALAFLGGTARYATGTGPGRTLEFGGWLGFHGFRFNNDKFVLLNESVETSRIVTALILEYAQRMAGVDIGWLSHALSVPSDNLFFAKKPRDIRGPCCTDRSLGGEDWTVYQSPVSDPGQPPCHSKPTKTAVITSQSSGTE